MGGMVKAIESGWAKLKIEEASAKKQARIDSGQDIIVGVNKFRDDGKSEFEIRDIDNTSVRASQLAKLKELKSKRDQAAVSAALNALENGARENANLLELAVNAMRVRATVGEVSDALRNVFGEYAAMTQTVSQVYSSNYVKDKIYNQAEGEISAFAKKAGRQPRILVAKLGQDGHDRGSKIIATGFADLGFDVDLSPLFQTPEEIARQAIENDVHVVGVSTQAGAHKSLVPELIELLAKKGAADIIVVVGGIIPPDDYEFLASKGVKAIFGPGTPVPQAALDTLREIAKQRKV
jgi:methylmalonyl-CoA mutase